VLGGRTITLPPYPTPVGCCLAYGGEGVGSFRFGLVDQSRPDPPPVISVDQVEEVIVATLEVVPLNATR